MRADVGLYVRGVGLFARAIDYYKNTVLAKAKHQVIEDAALRIEQHAVTLAALLQTDYVDGYQLFKSLRRLRA